MLATEIEGAIRSTLSEVTNQRAYASYRGPYSDALESHLCESLSSKSCLLTSSGSSAVEIALRAFGICAGDEVLLSGYDYPGNFWAIERTAARPVLIDTEEGSWSIRADLLPEILAARPNCKAIIVSHLHGQFQDISKIRELVGSRILIIEDCCQSIGARAAIQSERESDSASDFRVLSFGGGKVLSAGRGGALLTDSERWGQKAVIAAGAGSGPYGLSEVQAALVVAQLPFLDRINRVTQRFFAEVQKLLRCEDEARANEVEWLLPVDLADPEYQSGIYQFGILWKPTSSSKAQSNGYSGSVLNDDLATHSTGNQIDGFLPESQTPKDIEIGSGFVGFHRRSARRCETPIPLHEVPQVVSQTLVIHHRVALNEQIQASDVVSSLRLHMRG